MDREIYVKNKNVFNPVWLTESVAFRHLINPQVADYKGFVCVVCHAKLSLVFRPVDLTTKLFEDGST